MKKFFIFGPKCSLFGFLCLSSWFRMYINSFAAVFNKFIRMARQNGKEPSEKKSLRAGSKKKPIPRKTAVFSSDDEEKEGGAFRIDDSQGEEEEEEQPHTSDREFLNDSEPEYADSSDPLEDILSDDSADFVQKKPSRSSKAGNKSVASKKKAVTPPPATSDDDSEDFVRKKSRLSKSASKPTRAKAPSSPRNEDDPARKLKRPNDKVFPRNSREASPSQLLQEQVQPPSRRRRNLRMNWRRNHLLEPRDRERSLAAPSRRKRRQNALGFTMPLPFSKTSSRA